MCQVEADLPAASDIVASVAATSAEQHQELLAARAERGSLLDRLCAPHPLWDTADNKLAACTALQKAARDDSVLA
ncbi:hypothetical protein Skr01_33650 [Sphaerisporangium krabiense]|uniref:Uncharacterized protein n=1 Tax=Sphaerisporangium krabiense TaxID=763782 RepID=A0A7W9DPH0_9ACTN|nr:hypothetical protein [Sphaerisporangium krabiense]MBB5626363.1 hypothetical protein [Sphaerisporangium krabiense]GII63280.1 hypothetical protein Skr01_33650 [Sphaerisporangium krabiense]